MDRKLGRSEVSCVPCEAVVWVSGIPSGLIRWVAMVRDPPMANGGEEERKGVHVRASLGNGNVGCRAWGGGGQSPVNQTWRWLAFRRNDRRRPKALTKDAQ